MILDLRLLRSRDRNVPPIGLRSRRKYHGTDFTTRPRKETIIVTSRLICFVLTGSLLLQIGCSKTALIVRTAPHQNPNLSLPCDVKVTLKNEIVLHGKYSVFPGRAKTMAWRTNEISGKLLAWNDEMASIQIRNRDFEVPIEDIEKIEYIDKTRACLFTGGCVVLGAIIAAYITLIRLLNS